MSKEYLGCSASIAHRFGVEIAKTVYLCPFVASSVYYLSEALECLEGNFAVVGRVLALLSTSLDVTACREEQMWHLLSGRHLAPY